MGLVHNQLCLKRQNKSRIHKSLCFLKILFFLNFGLICVSFLIILIGSDYISLINFIEESLRHVVNNIKKMIKTLIWG